VIPRTVVVIDGGNAFVRRFSPESAARDARRIAKIFPGCTVRVVGYDPAPAADRDMASIVEDVAAIVRDEFGSATIAGISFGGLVALHLAAAHPELVRELILIVSAHRFSEEGRARVTRQIADAERGDFESMTRPFIGLFRRWWLNALMRIVMRFRTPSFNDPQTIVRTLRALSAAPPELRTIRARTLVIGGTRDQFFDRAAFEETAEAIASARLVLFEKETHMLPVERSRDVARAIAEFLRGGAPASRAG
jgi:pimeloyl-ACP methyl ester carboxylesterase